MHRIGDILLAVLLATAALTVMPGRSSAQTGDTLIIATIDRPPFSMVENGVRTGFSIDLMDTVATRLGRQVEYLTANTFAELLDFVETRRVDGAIANISITSAREEVMDFTQPIFEGGIQIMVPGNTGKLDVVSLLFNRQILTMLAIAIGFFFVAGMLMWLFERKKQEYFNHKAKDAVFPAFWWALNLVVNGGFEERLPRSVPGRMFAVFLVASSLFLVSIFVAQITATLTLGAINGSVNSVADLEGRRVGTTARSTASTLLTDRGIAHLRYEALDEVMQAFEDGKLDAVVHDGPILAYYISSQSSVSARLVDRVFRPENYGIALPADSALLEPVNRILLQIREEAAYQAISERWFGR